MVAPSVEQLLELNYASETTAMLKIFEEFALLKFHIKFETNKSMLKKFICSAQVDIQCLY